MSNYYTPVVYINKMTCLYQFRFVKKIKKSPSAVIHMQKETD